MSEIDDDSDFDDFGPDDEERECFHCGGEGWVECSNPLECTRQHIGNAIIGQACQCGSCGGSGLAKDMVIW